MRDRFERAVISGSPFEFCPLVDMHAHLNEFSNFHIPDAGLEGLLRVMERLGIDLFCASDMEAIGSDFEHGNRRVLEDQERSREKLLAYYTYNPHYPEKALAGLNVFIGEGGRLIKLHSALHGTPVEADSYRPALEKAREARCLVLSHTWDIEGGICSLKAHARLARTYPEIRFIWGHSGGPNGFLEAPDLMADLPNVYLDIVCSVNTYGMLEHFVRKIGSKRILYGSDFPFISALSHIGKVAFADLTEEAKGDILGWNAIVLLEELGIRAGARLRARYGRN